MGYFLPSDVRHRNRTPRVSSCTRKSVARRSRLQERGARFYSAAPGRWISRDPIGEDGGENCYAHTRNQSVNLVDPWGLMAMNWNGKLSFTVKGGGTTVYTLDLDASIQVTTLNEGTETLALRTETTVARPDSMRTDWNNALSKWKNVGKTGSIPYANNWYYPNLLNVMDNELAGSAYDGMFVKISNQMAGCGKPNEDDTASWRTAGTKYGDPDPNRPSKSAKWPNASKDAKSLVVVSSITSKPLDASLNVCPKKGTLTIKVWYPQGESYGVKGSVDVSLDWELKTYSPLDLTLSDIK
jgi:RHS repeat-associated protein